ncbi:universal stress protein [Patulibacter sp. S7RM1-6]|jgi:nucleotide-binding universal stress UspA family protein
MCTLLAYDGTQAARNAIAFFARTHPGSPVIVVTVWESLMTEAGVPKSDAGLTADVLQVDRRAETAAHTVADEGADLATALGLSATPQTTTMYWRLHDAVLNLARDVDASLIVVGASERHGPLGARRRQGLAHQLLLHSDRAILVVPDTGP